MNAHRPSIPPLALALAAAGLLGCAEEEPAVGPAPAGGGIAVVGSDYTSTVISLIDIESGAVVRNRCLDSGSRAPQLSAALSGDVTLPSEVQPGHELLVIDRKNSTLTWLDGATCEVRRQMNVGEGFAANPQDVVAGPGAKAYVTRYDRHPARPGEGSDLLVIDRTQAKVLGRIALPAPAPAEVPPGKSIDPRPSRAVRIGDRLYVALNNLSGDFEAATAGRIAVIDVTTDSVATSIDLPALKNCGSLTRVPGPAGREALVVGCTGVYADGPKQIDAAGFAWVDLDRTPPSIEVVPARRFPHTVSGPVVAVVSADLAFTVLAGEPGGSSTDTVWRFDFHGGEPRKVIDGSGAFELTLALGRERNRLYVLDAEKTQPRVQVYAVRADGTLSAMGSVVASPATGLPPRHLAFY